MKKSAYTDGPPFYGGTAYEDLAMPLQGQALVAAKRHLRDFHGLGSDQKLSRAASGGEVMKAHLKAHGLAGDSLEPTEWNLVSGPHHLAEIR